MQTSCVRRILEGPSRSNSDVEIIRVSRHTLYRPRQHVPSPLPVRRPNPRLIITPSTHSIAAHHTSMPQHISRSTPHRCPPHTASPLPSRRRILRQQPCISQHSPARTSTCNPMCTAAPQPMTTQSPQNITHSAACTAHSRCTSATGTPSRLRAAVRHLELSALEPLNASELPTRTLLTPTLWIRSRPRGQVRGGGAD